MENQQQITFAANHHIVVRVQQWQILIKYKFTRFLKKSTVGLSMFFFKTESRKPFRLNETWKCTSKDESRCQSHRGGGGNREA